MFNGDTLKYLRKLNNLTMDEVVVQLKPTLPKASISSISAYELGKQQPRVDMVLAISELFKVPFDLFYKNTKQAREYFKTK